MRNCIFPRSNFLRYLRSIHVSYHPGRPKKEVAKELIMHVSSESVKRKFPLLKTSWELLAYDAPATVEVELLDGRKYKRIIEGYSKAEQQKIIDDWRFSASMEPWPEVVAPQPKSASQSTNEKDKESAETFSQP